MRGIAYCMIILLTLMMLYIGGMMVLSVFEGIENDYLQIDSNSVFYTIRVTVKGYINTFLYYFPILIVGFIGMLLIIVILKRRTEGEIRYERI